MHVNPRLTDGLPDFYHRHLGRALNNQLWLATPDAILRQAVGRPVFRVYHMQTPETLDEGANQVREVTISEEVNRVVIALVGDLAAYRPGAKLVVAEGGGESEFDLSMIRDLFPELQTKVNLISGGVSAATSRRLVCDASTVGMWHTSDTRCGAETADDSADIRWPLAARDRHCQFRGCLARHCDAHLSIGLTEGPRG